MGENGKTLTAVLPPLKAAVYLFYGPFVRTRPHDSPVPQKKKKGKKSEMIPLPNYSEANFI